MRDGGVKNNLAKTKTKVSSLDIDIDIDLSCSSDVIDFYLPFI